MRKLSFLIPIALWILDYFLLKHADMINAFQNNPSAVQIWWAITCIVGCVLVIPVGIVCILRTIDTLE